MSVSYAKILVKISFSFQFACIVAGAQKLMGPAGVTVVIIRDDMLGKERKECPTIWNFKKQVDAESRLNTPPCYRLFFIDCISIALFPNHGQFQFFF